MSMQGGIGAAQAARELLELIAKLRAEVLSESQILSHVEARAKEIVSAGDSGWY